MKSLATEVNLLNTAHRTANIFAPEYLRVLAGFVGKRITLADGKTFCAPLKKALKPFERNDERVRVWLEKRHRDLHLYVWVSLEEGGRVHSKCFEVDFGYLVDSDGILSPVPVHKELRHDWTVEEIRKIHSEIKAAEQAVTDAKAKVPIGFDQQLLAYTNVY